jgi:O-antigen/teichoic acid export membrane protein
MLEVVETQTQPVAGLRSPVPPSPVPGLRSPVPPSPVPGLRSPGASTRWLLRAKVLTKFLTVQVAVQAMGVASGILLVRALPKTEYAYFTLANSMLATMSILGDSGIGIALSSIGGRVWQDRHRFGQLISTALRLRRYLAGTAAVAVTPILIWLLIRSGAPRFYAVVVTLIVLVGLNYQLLAGLLMIVPRLHSQISRVQRLDALVAASRLVLLSVAWFIFLDAAVAVAVSIVALIAQYLLLKHWAKDSVELHAPINKEDQSTMLGIVKHQAPNAVFYCLQGQLTVWLISIFGNTQNIAEIGALSRLGVVFSIISAVMASIVLPSFARCQSAPELRRRYFLVVGGFLIFGLGLISAAALFPDQVLWILGSKYAHLRSELLLMMIMCAFGALVSAMWSLNSAKAWIKYSWLYIPATVITQGFLLLVLDMSTVRNVLWFGIISFAPSLLVNAILSSGGLMAVGGDTRQPQTS